MGEPHRHNAEVRESDTEENSHTFYLSIYFHSDVQKQAKLICGDLGQNSGDGG